MYKPVTTDDIFSAADGNRAEPVMQSNGISAPLVNSTTEPQKPQSQMSDAEAIRSMGDRLAKIWED
jgi:hypothetical protein